MFRYIAIMVTALIFGCDVPELKSTRVCNVHTSLKYHVDPDPRDISISLNVCDDGVNELLVSLSGNDTGSGWVLIKEPIINLDINESTKLIDLGIDVRNSDFREYTITLPSYINLNRYMSLEERDGLKCKDIKDITLCFST
ncbi:hypothetical protein [Ketobacter alkanivorans]|uniref:Uncharacterized protein n=1 Tax=Ketobacter alkanivorans TaxID=1917421 RepID=A0A2K9LQV1_9GAMM|nr:hypothetical protein [Ketobacter alkanivorans]AUM14729.1 hypothetical protein Kalk_20860 [Ketobacter alkanivorans]